MNTSKTIIFFGTEDFSLTVLTALIETGYTIGAVVTKPDTKKGRGQQLSAPPVKILATMHNIPVWQPEKLKDITSDILAFGNPAGVLVSYGKIIPQATIDLFSPGIINVHPSLLPKYRGPTPIESAIANGDKTTGVSIMELTAKMDAGPVYAAKEYSLSGTETQFELYQTLASFGADLLLETLPRILSGSTQPKEQNEAEATYCSLLSKDDAWLDTSKYTAEEAERLIRAHLVFPKSKIKLQDKDIIVTKAHVSVDQKTPLHIEFRGGAFLSVDELIAPSGKRMNADAFLRGYVA
jgi:methionyl-tRNA formyltransferase